MKQFEMAELTFHALAPTGSHVQVDITAVVTGEGETITVKGFYCGDDCYKVRFLPKASGEYTVDVKGVVQSRVNVQIEPADPAFHGLVKARGTHLYHEDGTRFDSFGTTVYALAHQEPELVEQTLETLKNSPFNKVRMCIFPKHYAYNKNEPENYAFHLLPGKTLPPMQLANATVEAPTGPRWDVHHPDFAFWDRFEQILTRLQHMEIQVDLILFHPYDRWGFSTLSVAEDIVYLDYLIRRLSAFPNIWWSMANEYDLCVHKTRRHWHKIDSFLSSNDPYGHMLSNHNCFAPYDYKRKGITHISLQSSVMNQVSQMQKKYHKPVLYDECCYEGNLAEGWGSISAKEMVNRFWKVTVSGGWCTHGETYLHSETENVDEAVIWWAKGGRLVGESPARIAFLRQLIASLPGQLDPHIFGIGQLLAMPRVVQKIASPFVPKDARPYFQGIANMGHTYQIRFADAAYEYAGHIGEDVFLFYYGTNCHSRVILELSKEKQYTIEVIDAWNMTRTVAKENASGTADVKLPGREYIAVLAIANN